MNAQEKKSFAPIIKTYANDLSKRWRIEWFVPAHNGNSKKRIVKYGDINKGSTIQERLTLAHALIKEFKFLQTPRENKNPTTNNKNILIKALELSSINWRKSTKIAYHRTTKTFLDFIAPLDPKNVDLNLVNDYILFLKEQNASQYKIRKYCGFLRTVYNKAIDFNLIEKNPVPILKLKKPKATSLLFFDDEQISTLKSAKMPGELCIPFCRLEISITVPSSSVNNTPFNESFFWSESLLLSKSTSLVLFLKLLL